MKCRHCDAPLSHVAIDLGHQPPSNAYLSVDQLELNEVYAPLKVLVCDTCWLVQIPSHHQAADLFTPEYAYFSSVSTSWVEHARQYAKQMTDLCSLDSSSFVVEIASNDGYLLQFFQEAGIPCLGIEPTASTARAARDRGIDTIEEFFGERTSREITAARRPADLMTANNVLAHVPDINDFVAGFREMLAPSGVATFEFPHVMRLVEGRQFDTIYHEHYSYLSLTAVQAIFSKQGLMVFDVEELPTHGGSLRVFACRADGNLREVTSAVPELIEREQFAGVTSVKYYQSLQVEADRIKFELLDFLVEQKKQGKTVAGYGAAAKGNTLLNFAGVRADAIAFICDGAPSKQGKLMPGSHIPILAPEALDEHKPDYVLILPWNLREEIMAANAKVYKWGGNFVTAIPGLSIR